MIPDPLHAVIFDLDGLLLDTERVFHGVMFDAGRSLGYEMTDELFFSMIGSPRDVNEKRLLDKFGPAFPLMDYYKACAQGFETVCAKSVPLRPGAERLLDMLKTLRVPRAVATSSSMHYARTSLKRAGVLDYFTTIVTRGDVERGKPHPDSFLLAAKRLNVKPDRCLALEDSIQGVRAASSAGMATVMVPDFLQPEPDVRRLCAGVVESLDDVADAVKEAIGWRGGL